MVKTTQPSWNLNDKEYPSFKEYDVSIRMQGREKKP